MENDKAAKPSAKEKKKPLKKSRDILFKCLYVTNQYKKVKSGFVTHFEIISQYVFPHP